MKRNNALCVSWILGAAYAAYSIFYWFSTFLSTSDQWEAVGVSIATVIVLPHMVCAVLALLFNFFGWLRNSKAFALTGAILYTVSLVLFPAYFMFVILQAILSFVGFATMAKAPEKERNPYSSMPAPSPRPAQPKPFTLTSRDLARTDGMMTYCNTFGFQSGASADLCRVLFTAAESQVSPDTCVALTFMAVNDYQSAASNSGFCAVVFAASKVIVSRSGGCDVYPVMEISAFRSEPCDSKTVILMEHQGGVCRFGVEPIKAPGILGCCTSALEDCKKSILEEQGAMP